jgi:capsule polysaccharide export protein KpsC/LpsZ
LSALNWLVDIDQHQQIEQLVEVCEKQQEEIDELKKNVEMLSKWILHLKGIECPITPNNA